MVDNVMVDTTGRFWTVGADGLVITVRVTPKGGRDAIDGVARLGDGRSVMKVRVRAAPSGGAANAAVIKLIAAALGTAPGNVDVATGSTGRIKRIKVNGDPAVLAMALGKIVG